MRDALLLGVIIVCLLAALRRPFAGLLVWAWFSLMSPHQLAYGVYGLPLNVIIAAGAIIAIIVNGDFRRWRFDRLTGLLLLFAFWLCLSQVFSLNPENSAVYFDRFIKLLVFVVLCAQMTTDKLRFHSLVWMLTIGIGFFALKGAVFTIVTLGQYRVQGLPNTILEDNNHMGTAIAAILPMILYLRDQASVKIVRIGLLILFCASIVAILGTHSRGAFLALIFFSGFFWLRSRRKFAILAGLALLLAPAIAFMPVKWTERMTTITEATEDASFMGRVDAWVINMKLAVENPLTGAGLRNPYQKEIARTVDPRRAESAKAAHSVYFEVLGGAGFVGFFIYLALLATAFFTALGLYRRRKDPTVDPWLANFGYYAQMSLVVFCVGGAAVSVEMWEGYLIVIALIAAASKLLRTAPSHVAATEPAETSRLLRWRVAARGRAIGRR